MIGARRLKAFGCLLCAWALLLLAAARWPRARAWAMRAGAIGVLWSPVAVLIPAALEPSAPVEYATIALACLGLGALTDALLPWPRAPLAAAIAAVVALAVDALAGTQLLMRSLLGPNPILGARFYGIGNRSSSPGWRCSCSPPSPPRCTPPHVGAGRPWRRPPPGPSWRWSRDRRGSARVSAA